MESLRELYKIGRGPSSSHTMGPERAALDFLKRCPEAESFRAVLYGSLALTGKGHLTDEIIIKTLAPRACEIIFDYVTHDLPHPNVLDLQGLGKRGEILLTKRYLSIGGGTIRIDGEPEAKIEHIYPFENFAQIKSYCVKKNCTLQQAAFDFEGEGLFDFLIGIWNTMQSTIRRGLSAEGYLPGKLHLERKAKKLLETVDRDEDLLMREQRLMCAFAFASSEENASGGRVVTAPTCGACGVLPATIFFLRNKYGFSDRKIVDALAAAGLIGAVVKQNGSVSGAEAGCQAEIGTATSMAAVAVCTLFDLPIDGVEYAAGVALEHQLGLTCDPVCGYVQIPCIERNAVAALRALVSAQLATVLRETRKISFDLLVEAMKETGKDLNVRYRETSEGGLAAIYHGDS